MTAVNEPQARAGMPARAWRAFRNWRRGRPFWGGLVTIVAGIEFYLSVHLNPTSISVSFGQNGFVAWLLPLALVLCGVLAWLSPAQRIFYGIIATAASVYGLIGLNLGGFFLGMLIGIVGGSLVAAWSPRQPQRVAGDDEPARYGAPTVTEPDTDPAELRSGPLSDELPESSASPLAAFDRLARDHSADEQPETGQPATAGWSAWVRPATDESAGSETTAEQPVTDVDTPTEDGSEALDSASSRAARHAAGAPEPRRSWRHRGRGTALVLVPLTLAAVGVLTIQHTAPAYAAPSTCPTTAPSKPAGKPATTPAAPKPTTTATQTPAAPAPETSSPATDGQGNPIGNLVGGIINGIGSLLGATDTTPSASPSTTPTVDPTTPAPPTATAKPTPTGTGKATSKPKASTCPSASASAAPANATLRPAVVGQPPVAAKQATLKTHELKMDTVTYDGVFDLPLKGGGTVQALKFSMASAVQTPFELDIPVGDTQVVQNSSQLTISGTVEFYCTSFSGVLTEPILVPLPLTFTPLLPPPVTFDKMTFVDVTILLAYVHADLIVAPNFGNLAQN